MSMRPAFVILNEVKNLFCVLTSVVTITWALPLAGKGWSSLGVLFNLRVYLSQVLPMLAIGLPILGLTIWSAIKAGRKKPHGASASSAAHETSRQPGHGTRSGDTTSGSASAGSHGAPGGTPVGPPGSSGAAHAGSATSGPGTGGSSGGGSGAGGP